MSKPQGGLPWQARLHLVFMLQAIKSPCIYSAYHSLQFIYVINYLTFVSPLEYKFHRDQGHV